MLAEIQITQLKQPARYSTDRPLHPPAPPEHLKQFVPIKQYSNKFLRQSASQQSQPKKQNNKLIHIVNKHKSFQKKYHKILNKPTQVCKTQPNQNQYQCFTTYKHFYHPQYNKTQKEQKRTIKTEIDIEKENNKQAITHNESLTLIDPEPKNNIKYDCFLPKKDEKISTSRALELFSKIVAKDKNDLLDRIKLSNQHKQLKDKLIESSKNLQAKQIVLNEKIRKFSFNQKKQRKMSFKTTIKCKQKKIDNHTLFPEEDNFEIKGWDFFI